MTRDVMPPRPAGPDRHPAWPVRPWPARPVRPPALLIGDPKYEFRKHKTPKLVFYPTYKEWLKSATS